MQFTWDPAKRELNLAKHGIDFADAVEVFAGAKLYVYRSDRKGEERYTGVGVVNGLYLAVAYTDRLMAGTLVRRVISARRARDNECKAYDAA